MARNGAEQVRQDRWLAEEILSLVFGGHKKGHFARLSFETLREFGLPKEWAFRVPMNYQPLPVH